jgi:hypothetical protein
VIVKVIMVLAGAITAAVTVVLLLFFVPFVYELVRLEISSL